MQTPCSDYRETKGLIYFARMLDKIRLRAQGKLPDDYFTGVEDPTFFDARCTRFLGVDYDELTARTLEGGSDEEILEWCFVNGRKPSEEEIEIWNAFLAKRGWRDAGSEDLQAAKQRADWGERADIQTWVDLHQAEEGRLPAPASSSPNDDEKIVAALDTEYQAAVKKNDMGTMDRILADDFVLVNGVGQVFTKADVLEEARSQRMVYERQEDSEQTVRVWGDTAIVTALLWAKGTEDGQPFDYKLWFSDTYVRTPRGWRYAFAQSTPRLPKSS